MAKTYGTRRDREGSVRTRRGNDRAVLCAFVLVAGMTAPAAAQVPTSRFGEAIPRDVRELYDRGLQYLAKTQSENGDWPGGGGENGPGTTGMAMMVFLACGEDPNFGPYSNHIRLAIRNMIKAQDSSTGIMGPSMYHHGFATLALAEAYGVVDERGLWPDGKGPRTIGQALELAVRGALTSQKKNPLGAWRYSPDAHDADTSVSGAVFVGLLAARNAGIEVPDESIDKAISFYAQMTSASGEVAYQGMAGFGDSLARSSIATLVYSVARRKDLKQFKATLEYLRQRADQPGGGQAGWTEYARYYEAQALFQGDVAVWEKWNRMLVRQLKQAQMADGSIRGQQGAAVGTSLSLLALAVNFRFLPIYER
jgi:hypothetical protein